MRANAVADPVDLAPARTRQLVSVRESLCPCELAGLQHSHPDVSDFRFTDSCDNQRHPIHAGDGRKGQLNGSPCPGSSVVGGDP